MTDYGFNAAKADAVVRANPNHIITSLKAVGLEKRRQTCDSDNGSARNREVYRLNSVAWTSRPLISLQPRLAASYFHHTDGQSVMG